MTAKYMEIYDALAERISGMKPGDKLDSETSLAQEFAVSPMTVRRALNLLGQRGLTVGIRGKGTFVSHKPIGKKAAAISFSDTLRAEGRRPSSRLLSGTIRPCSADEAQALNLTLDDFVYEISRIRLGDGIPLCLERCVVTASRFPGLLNEDLTGSLHELYSIKYGTPPASSRFALRAALATKDEAAALEITRPAACLHVKTLTTSEDTTPMELSHSTYRADLYEFEV